MHQLHFVVEALGHPIGVAMPHRAYNRFTPAHQRTRHALERLQRTVARTLNASPKCGASWFVIFTLEPLAQVLHPVNHFTELGKASAPVGTGDQRVHIALIGQLQPTFAKLCALVGFLWRTLFFDRLSHRIECPHCLLDPMEPVNHLDLIAKDLVDRRIK